MSHDVTSRWQASMMDNYGTPPLTLARGDGAVVWDADGNRFLDLVGGIAVNALGHAHPAIAEAVGAQLRRLGHVSNLFSHAPGVELAETLLRLAGVPDGRVFFCNSGAEANETAFKIARRTGRTGVVAADGGFHGRTMGALALTGQPAKRAPFEPLVPGVTHVSYGDVAALDAAVTSDTAAVILEPILGEGGVVPAPDGYLRAAREITNRHRSLLILDEVQTGIGRTGSWFAFQQAGITPDVLTLAKGLGGGLPIGACIGFGEAGRLLRPGDHGTTFGGNPVSAAAALAVLRIVADDDLADHAATVGKEIAAGLEGLPAVDHVRGFGLLLGVALDGPSAGAIATAARERGFLVNPVQPDVIRLTPALVLTSEQAAEFVSAWPAIAAAAGAGRA